MDEGPSTWIPPLDPSLCQAAEASLFLGTGEFK